MDSRSGTSAKASGTRWVFLRGLVRESAHWGDFPRRFAAEVPGASVACFDLPGNGRHWALASPVSIRDTMEFVRAEWLERDAAGCAGAVHLFSVSLGSMVALEWLNQYPGEVAGAVLINTSLRGFSPLRRRLRWQIWPLLVCAMHDRDAASRERRIVDLTTARLDPGRASELARQWARIAMDHPVQPVNAVRQLVAAARYAPPIRKPAAPLLLLGSRGDRMVDPRCTEDLAAEWNLSPRIHPDAGHDLPLDDPAWVIDQVRGWLHQPAHDIAVTPAGA